MATRINPPACDLAFPSPREWLKAFVFAGLLLSVLTGCNKSDTDGNSNQPPAPQTNANDGSLLTVATAMQEPRITMNNPWTAQDLDDMKIDPDPIYAGATFTTWKKDYDKKIAECEAFGDEKDGNGELICVPRKSTANQDCTRILEYGYYCGAGRPANGYWNKEPLDGVDYCCYLHDLRAWQGGRNPPDDQGLKDEIALACGAIMCMTKVTAYPAGADSQFPDMMQARQCINDWAKAGCGGNQPADPPEPAVQYNPP